MAIGGDWWFLSGMPREHRSWFRPGRGGRIPRGWIEAGLGAALLGGIGFGPWAFGATEGWSIGVLAASGGLAGVLSLWLRRRDRADGVAGAGESDRGIRWLGGLTVAGLVLQAVAVLNARSTFDEASLAFVPRAHLDGLPSSYDLGSSLRALGAHLGLAGVFWGTRAWLRRGPGAGTGAGGKPERWQRLLMFVATNAFLVALVALLQRLDNTDRLLWLVEPRIHRTAGSQFGPFAYRSNGLQYLALAWPLALGLWSTLTRARRGPERLGSGRRWWLLAAAATMAVCPFLWDSRLAWVVGAGSLLAAVGLLAAAHRSQRGWAVAALVVLVAVGSAVAVNWGELSARASRVGVESAERGRILSVGGRMIREHPLWGTGPGTFGAMHLLYRADGRAAWQVQMHCDWLQSVAENGIAGGLLVAAFVGVLAVRPWSGRGIAVSGATLGFVALGLAGVGLSGWLDFPLQVYSIAHLAAVVAGLYSSLTIAGTARTAGQPGYFRP